VGKFEL
jgi:hypothetical protein